MLITADSFTLIPHDYIRLPCHFNSCSIFWYEWPRSDKKKVKKGHRGRKLAIGLLIHELDSTHSRFTITKVTADSLTWANDRYRGAFCDHPLLAMANSWTRGATCIHTTVPISYTRPSPVVRKLLLGPLQYSNSSMPCCREEMNDDRTSYTRT